MGLILEQDIADQLPSSVKVALSKMDEEQQMMFTDEYKKKRKTFAVMLLIAVFLPGIQLVLLNKTGLAFVFWLTFMMAGIWYILELFLTYKRVGSYNEDLAVQILRNQKLLA